MADTPNQSTLAELLTAWLATVPEADATCLLETACNDALALVQATLRDQISAVLLQQVQHHLHILTTEVSDPAAALHDELAALRALLSQNEANLTNLQEATSTAPSHPPAFSSTIPIPPADLATPAAPATPTVSAAPADLATPAAPAAPASTTGVYVYGIFAPHRADALPDLPTHGVDPAYPVYLLHGNGLCALVSQVGLGQFGEDVIEANLHDPVWLEAQVRQHQAVLSALLPHGTVLPFTFGTIFHSEERVQEMLHAQAQHWHARLAYLHGREEWGVKLFCDPAVLRDAVVRSHPQAQRLQERIAQAGSGTAYMLKQQLEILTKNAVEEQIQMIADTIHATLLHDAVAGVRNPLPAPELSQPHAQVILNAAYLLHPDQLDPFRHELEQQIRAYAAYGITADLSGAWVPYNFANVDLPDHATTTPPLNPAELQEQP